MSRPTDRSTGRVESPNADHLTGAHEAGIKGADSSPERPVHVSSSAERIGRIALTRLRTLLSERDMAIIASVDQFRYLSGGQINRLHFHSHASAGTAARTARSVLNRLVGGRLVRRTERRIGGIRGGSSSYVYGIGPVGHRLLHDDGSRGRWDEPSTTFLDHTLAIADLAIGLTEATRTEHASKDAPLQIQTEPGCWRPFTKGLGGREVLKPDLFLSLVSGEYEDRWFIEMDMATESTTAVQRKCQTYLDYHRSGIEQHQHEVFPRVLWIVPTDKRARQIQDVVDRLRAPAGLFSVTVAGHAVNTVLGQAEAAGASAGGSS
jgi:hypothetical protein